MTTYKPTVHFLFLALLVTSLNVFPCPTVAAAEEATVSTTGTDAGKSSTSEDPASDASETEETTQHDAVLLRYRFKRGQFVHYEEDSRSEMTLMAREQTQATRENRRTNKHFRVISVDQNGSAVIEPVIDRVQMEVRNDDDPAVLYDSADEGDVARDFQKVEKSIGRPSLRIRYAANGKIEELLPLMSADAEQAEIDDPEKQNFLIAFPEEAIVVGESWTDNYLIDVSVDGKLRNPLTRRVKIRRTYTLKDVTDGIATIQFRTFPLSVERDPQVKVQLVHHSRFGSIQFDLERGMILEWKSSGSGHVFNAFGPASSMKALSSTTERYVPAPAAIENRQKKRAPGPAGPQLPGTASL